MKQKTIFSEEKPLVSVLCTTFNQKAYIEEAIESLINQNTSFPYEILIHDDKSSDGTTEIVEKYKSKYPGIIKAYFEEENQYSKGVAINTDLLLPEARGKYIAICEGDDYWCDTGKLERQVKYMETHPECSLCISNAKMVNLEGEKIGEIHPVSENSVVSIEKMIIGGGEVCATNSILCYRDDYLNRPGYFNIIDIDYILQIYLASKGKVYCFVDELVAYRTGVPGSWSQSTLEKKQTVEIHKKIINALESYDKANNFIYHEIVQRAILNRKYIVDAFEKKNIFACKEYHEILAQLPVSKKVSLWMDIFCPSVKEKVKNIIKRER